jgi:hypothetical protein
MMKVLDEFEQWSSSQVANAPMDSEDLRIVEAIRESTTCPGLRRMLQCTGLLLTPDRNFV